MAMKKSNKLPTGYIEVKRTFWHVRKDADPRSESLGKPVNGTRLYFYGNIKNGWYKVKFNDQIGYIHGQAGKAVEVKETYLTAKKGVWHVRTAPDSKAKSLGTIKTGEKVLSQDQTKGGWHLVIFKNQNGWISTKAIEKEEK